MSSAVKTMPLLISRSFLAAELKKTSNIVPSFFLNLVLTDPTPFSLIWGCFTLPTLSYSSRFVQICPDFVQLLVTVRVHDRSARVAFHFVVRKEKDKCLYKISDGLDVLSSFF